MVYGKRETDLAERSRSVQDVSRGRNTVRRVIQRIHGHDADCQDLGGCRRPIFRAGSRFHSV